MAKNIQNTENEVLTREQKQKTNTGRKKNNIFIWLISLIITLPIFSFLSEFVPHLNWYLNIDRWLLAFIVFTLIFIIVYNYKYLFIGIMVAYVVIFSYGSITNGWGWKEAGETYLTMIFQPNNKVSHIDKGINNKTITMNKTINSPKMTRNDEIRMACNYRDSSVRNFALHHTSSLTLNINTTIIPLIGENGLNKHIRKYYDTLNQYEEAINKLQKNVEDYSILHFTYTSNKNNQHLSQLKAVKENFASQIKYMEIVNELYQKLPYKTIIQVFSLFKYTNEKWDYVCDPKGEEYFAKASESINTLKGDCDDYAILLASCVQAIGGEARIVLTNNHAFPELKIEKENFDTACFLLRTFFSQETKDSDIHYHVDNKDENIIWLNMDRGKYPGSKFSQENLTITDIIYLKY